MANDYTGSAPFVYARTSNDAKITYIPNDNTQIFGKYSTEPFQVLDPQELGAAGGGTFDGGQPGAGHGHIQNVGMGMSHVINANLVMDADFGYTRQWSGAESVIDLAARKLWAERTAYSGNEPPHQHLRPGLLGPAADEL